MTAVQAVTRRATKRLKVKPTTKREYRPSVSIVIACYNYGRYLPAAVQSCLSQEDVTVEVIIVDDSSTDDSLDIAKGLCQKHANISLIAHATNTGPVEAFNDGARSATGEFLVRLDADDLLTPGSLGRATLLAQSFPSVGLVYGHPLHFSQEPLPNPRLRATAWTIWPGAQWLADRCQSGKNVITSPEVLMRRSLVAALGYMAPLAHSHDMELWLRLSAFADVAYIHGADQAWHRDHADSLSARCVDELRDFRERIAAFEVLFSGPAAEKDDAARLEVSARKALATESLQTARHEKALGAKSPVFYSCWLEHAKTLDVDIVKSREWVRVNRGLWFPSLPRPLRIYALGVRLRGRISSELQWYRWHRTGVY